VEKAVEGNGHGLVSGTVKMVSGTVKMFLEGQNGTNQTSVKIVYRPGFEGDIIRLKIRSVAT
jgi:hypothetical protein